MEFERSILAAGSGNDLYSVVGQEELRNGIKQVVPRFKVKKPAPPRWSTVAGDVIHNARSALDLIAGQCLIPGRNIEHCKFPFGKTEKIFEGALKEQRKNIAPKAARFIKRLKPYKGGNDSLWLLHSLDLMDKHRLLIVVGAVDAHVTLMPKFGLPDGQVPFARLTQKREGLLKDGDEVFVVPLPPPLDMMLNQQIKIEIRFGGVEELPEMSAVKTLAQLVRYVEKIVTIAERHLF